MNYSDQNIAPLSGSTILFLGAGQVGIEAARQCAVLGPATMIIHCLTEVETNRAIASLRASIGEGPDRPKLVGAFGNVLWPAKLANQSVVAPGSADEEELIAFLYGQLEPRLVTGSFLYQLVARHRPEYIVDAINTATAVGYRQCIYDAVREAMASGNTSRQNILAIARSTPEPKLVRFVQILKAAMEEFGVRRYVKVSTTGLGGMGFNIKYTHGDLGEPGLSTKLLGKVSAAGILHQLLWTLRHTPGFNVNLVIPAALIGWGEMGIRPQESENGASIPLVDCAPIEIEGVAETTPLEELTGNRCFFTDQTLQGVAVASGENGDYSWHDMAAITALGQMGCITKEEVAEAVVENLQGRFNHCVLTAMDRAQLSESSRAFGVRTKLMEAMAELAQSSGIPSASFMNLGPRVAKYLWELEIMSRVTPSLGAATTVCEERLAAQCQEDIVKGTLLRRTILALGLLIATQDLLYLPPNGLQPPRTLQEVNDLADSRVVDLRLSRLRQWKVALQTIIQAKTEDRPDLAHTNLADVDINAPIRAGETLALWFTLTGGGKKPKPPVPTVG